MSTLFLYILLISISLVPFAPRVDTNNKHSFLEQKEHPQFLNPIRKKDFKYISSRYGWRLHPLTGKWQFHNGIDIVSYNELASVYSTQSGKVSNINKDPNQALGLWIEIKHLNGYTTRYGHLSKITVAIGAIVAQGQEIGVIGNTGSVSGRHLHYETKKNGQFINPLSH